MSNENKKGGVSGKDGSDLFAGFVAEQEAAGKAGTPTPGHGEDADYVSDGSLFGDFVAEQKRKPQEPDDDLGDPDLSL